MPRVAVIGCGSVSVVHFEAIRAIPGAELVAVCDSDAATSEAASAQHGVPGYADHRALLDEVRPDVVHVSTPHHQHVPLAIDALSAGVAVLMEKPVARTVDEAQALIAAAEASPAKIGICFQNRYNATTQAIRTLIDSGELGAVLGGSASVTWNRPTSYYTTRPWRGQQRLSGGGVMINQAIHTLDALLWLLGDATAVAGRSSRHVLADEVDVEDTAHLVIDHATGARSVLFATVANVVDSPVTMEIVTEQATCYLRGDLTIRYADGRVEQVPERVAASGGRAYWGVSHELLIDDFYRRLDDPEPFWISPAEALKSLAVIEQLYAFDSRGANVAPDPA
ncbi:MAG TPA: Gfo/Idh/MocA family oxidoreductase [Propionibacteriaceae bacterium]|nr:Gfo/Idh/MocA family oxidoreductase [Propionibacteriaceae bacterium]